MDQNTSLHRLVFQKLQRPIPACWSPIRKPALDLNTISYAEKGGEPTCPECKEMVNTRRICPSEAIAAAILKHPDFRSIEIKFFSTKITPTEELANVIDKILKEINLI